MHYTVHTKTQNSNHQKTRKKPFVFRGLFTHTKSFHKMTRCETQNLCVSISVRCACFSRVNCRTKALSSNAFEQRSRKGIRFFDLHFTSLFCVFEIYIFNRKQDEKNEQKKREVTKQITKQETKTSGNFVSKAWSLPTLCAKAGYTRYHGLCTLLNVHYFYFPENLFQYVYWKQIFIVHSGFSQSFVITS